MRLFAPRPNDPAETRTPVTPAVIQKLVELGVSVTVARGLGDGAFIADQAFEEAGATLADENQAPWAETDLVVTIVPPAATDVARMKSGALLVGVLSPTTQTEVVQTAAQSGVSALSLEFVPRISRAQAMDVLSSQANLAGYKAVLLGASHCPKLMPMMITAAGTLKPGRVFVIGVGVAGLQAIATAKRLGAVVEAYDVRPATKEQVQSLGARFVELPGAGGGEDAGGYAKQQTDEERQQQAQLMAKHVAAADVVVTTAAVFGKAPPMLIPADVVATMQAGSVVVDLAASPEADRGNCELTQPGRVSVTDNQVTIVGTTNLPGTLPVHASEVFANNVLALLKTLVAKGEEGAAPTLTLDPQDDIHRGALITHGGEVVHERVKAQDQKEDQTSTQTQTESQTQSQESS